MRVPGYGPTPSSWMLVGKGPGEQEAAKGIPFVGKTGEELKRFFDGDTLPPLSEVFRTNLYREFGGKDYDYTAEDFARDEPELLEEITTCQPTVLVAVGADAVRYFLGKDVTLDEVHGLPWRLPESSSLRRDGVLTRNDVVVFATYHPAAGFRSPEASALVSYDFDQLACFAAGDLEPRILYDDPIPNPQYFHVTGDAPLRSLQLLGVEDLGVDSEGYPRKPWSVQWSAHAGTGYLARASTPSVVAEFLSWITKDRINLTFHSALHDRGVLRALARLCGWDEARILFELDTMPFDDTMVMAYLLQLEPQGLKGLATRHANMAMQAYDELLGDVQNRLATDWLVGAWDCLHYEYEIAQEQEKARINTMPLIDKKTGLPRRSKDGTVRYRNTSKLPALPKSPLFKAVERCLRAKQPYRLFLDQTEDVRDAGYRLLGAVPEATLSHVEFPRALHYGCRDADATVRVKPELLKRIKSLGLEDVYRLELGTYPLIDRMMVVGMKPDLAVFKALSRTLANEIADVQVRIEDHVGREGFNANSGDQVAEYLFHEIGLEPLKMTSGSSTREPRESTNDKILETLEKEHGHQYPVIGDFREYRELFKLKHTFVDRIPDFVHRWPYDGRVHATFRTTRVITGRLAASDPNILAQPEHGKFAKAFKAGWVAETGHYVGNWDLSQVELRVLAHLSRDPVLEEAYLYECPHPKDWQAGKTICKRDGCVLKGDLHSRLAHQVFAVMPSAQDDSRHRLPAKAVNFGIPMGMTCHGLMIELRKNGVEVDEDGAQEWLDATNKLYRKVPMYKEEKIAEARRHGFVRCLSGRIRYIGGIRSRDERVRSEAERFAFSTPIQEGAQRSMKEAEAFIWNEILMPYYREGYYRGGPKGRYVEPLVQIHDALKFEFPEGMEHDLNSKITHAMTKVPTPLRVPLGVEGKFGRNFRDMEKFKK